MTLIDLKTGEKAQILKINKGEQSHRRLFEIGILPGTDVEILSRHPFKGPLVVKVGSSKVAIGRGIASDVEVQKL